MDNAVALVEAYLRVNGYFTVAEYPIVEGGRFSDYYTRSEIDVMGFRFPGAGRLVNDRRRRNELVFEPDAALHCDPEHPDMLIGEVKEGRAELNAATRDPVVLRSVLERFGCSHGRPAYEVVQELLARGMVTLPSGHVARIATFGSIVAQPKSSVALQISMGHVIEFLRAYLREHWDAVGHAQFKDPAFGLLVAIEKAERGIEASPPPGRAIPHG